MSKQGVITISNRRGTACATEDKMQIARESFANQGSAEINMDFK